MKNVRAVSPFVKTGCFGEIPIHKLNHRFHGCVKGPISWNLSGLSIAGFQFSEYMESMKTTIDIPDEALADAMRFTGAKTKREAVVKALEEFNRRQKVEALLAAAGTFPDFPTNDEIEAADLEYEERMAKRWAGKP